MKLIKIKAIKGVYLFKMMDITEQQFKHAQEWYKSAKSITFITGTTPTS